MPNRMKRHCSLYPYVLPIPKCRCLSIEFASLHIDAVLSHCHSQVLHCKYSPVLTATLSTSTITRPLYTKGSSSPLLFLTTWCSCWLSRNRKACSGSQISHWVICI